ncbi:hypothetical protein TrLO_g7688 [Triparma laevis f. longispina]|uniref:Uncharacterized protein n=1 Tax=Triparma laevis f. longispina TaxID=1714387 RepID=A0A9W6ZKK2_9STRA|nr:hypothetical protein TrLO_g7688 [Triparma laevis f. longispina]
MDAHVVLMGTWELDPTRNSSIAACGYLKFTHYKYTVSMSNDGRNVTMNPQGMIMTMCSCFPIPEYKEGTQIATWDDEHSAYHFPGNPGDGQSPEYMLRSPSQGVFTGSDPRSGKEIFSYILEGSDKLRIEGPGGQRRAQGQSRPAFVLCMRRAGPTLSPPALAMWTAVVTPTNMVSPTTMTMEQHNASATVPVATAPAAKPEYVNITVPPG